jgi:hypothetical protein
MPIDQQQIPWPRALGIDTILFYILLRKKKLLQDCFIYCNSITNQMYCKENENMLCVAVGF